MSMPAQEDFWGLTEKERQTLRLIVRGHDAKSIASNLGLSVHTVNERLRDARRKMTVSSSREAARLLLDKEGDTTAPTPQYLGDNTIGEDAGPNEADEQRAPPIGVGQVRRLSPVLIGVLLMMLVLALLAATQMAQPGTGSPPATAAQTAPSEATQVASQWLALVDKDQWEESYKGTSKSFRKINTLQVWADTSRKMRGLLGAPVSRSFAAEEFLPAPPAGYQVVKFHASYANKADALETVSLIQEDGRWQVVGVMVE
jgi:DNA-binding CsgD family transcriptional regulator